MFNLLIKFYFINCSLVFQKKTEKYLERNSLGPATRFYCVHYFSKSSHLLSPLVWGVIWFWLLSAAVVYWCAYGLTLLFVECAVDTVQKEKLIMLCHILRVFLQKALPSDPIFVHSGRMCNSRHRVEPPWSLPLTSLFLRYFLTLRSHEVMRDPITFPALLF